MTFGERLRELRKARGYTQEQLANKIGVAKTTITGYEKNNREPNVLTITKLAQALDVSGNELICVATTDAPILARSPDEITLLRDYRRLTPQGKAYIRQTLDLALNAYTGHEDE